MSADAGLIIFVISIEARWFLMTNRAMKPRPGPVRQDGDFYTRPNTRNINNISINGKGSISFGGFDKYSESIIKSINSLKIIKGGEVDRKATIDERKIQFEKKLSASKRFRFNEQTGLIEENPQK